jgi:hypothetical protein
MSNPSALVTAPSESYPHFMAKAAMFYILRRAKHIVLTEWRVANGYVDIVDRTTRTFYEIERTASKKFRERKYELYKTTGYEVIVVDCSKMPSEIEELYKHLDPFVVPS